MSDRDDAPPVASLHDLYAIAYQIEADAKERYTLLADQMEVHNNSELARVFRDLARAEGIHGEEIRRMAGNFDVVGHAQRLARWRSGESPEAAELSEAHYLMAPRKAIEMALAGENRAVEFFERIVAEASDPEVRRLARELLAEERGHVELCHRLLQRDVNSRPEWATEDPDPPVSQE